MINSKKNELFANNPYSIQIKLYLDEFVIGNSIGDRAHELNHLGAYFQVGNLTDELLSKTSASFLIFIAASRFVKTYGLKSILNEFEQEVMKLEKDGIQIVNLKTKETIVLRGSISYLICDSLQANDNAGIVKCFNNTSKRKNSIVFLANE